MLSDLAFALAADDNLDIHVVTSRLLYDDKTTRLSAEETLNGVRVHRVLTSSLGRVRTRHQIFDYLTFFVTCSWKLFWLAKRGDTVVVKTDPPLMSVPTMVLTRLLRARQVNWQQDAFPEIAMAAEMRTNNRFVDGVFFGLLTRLRNESVLHTGQTVVLGERMLEHMASQIARPKRVRSKVSIIPNWTDTDAIVPVVPQQNPMRKQWELRDAFVVGYSGNMGIAHDFAVLLEAAQRLQSDERIQLLFIGNGKRKRYVQHAVKTKQISNVQFKPYQPRSMLAKSLSVPDVHIVTLRPEMEGLIVPSKFYGVAAAGRPTIFLGDLDGEIARNIAAFDCGVAVEPDDVEGLVKAIQTYSDNPDLAARHGANARQMAVEHFDLKVSVQKWKALLTD